MFNLFKKKPINADIDLINRLEKVEKDHSDIIQYTDYLRDKITQTKTILEEIKDKSDPRTLKEKGLIITVKINVANLSRQQIENEMAQMNNQYSPIFENIRECMAFVEVIYLPLSDNCSSTTSDVDIKII